MELTNQPCVLTSFGKDILHTNQTNASVWQLSDNGNDLHLFAGSDQEEGSTDGPVKECCFKIPVGICSKFESVVYVGDAQTNSIKLCAKLKECAHFLTAIGCLYKAFSMHDRGAHISVKSSEEAIGLVGQCREILHENTHDIQKLTGIHTTLNGLQGHVSARTMASVAMIETGLHRLHANLKQFKYDHTNLLSCMTLDVENYHATVHVKQVNLSQAEHCKSFGTTTKETVKCVTNWVAYYQTSRRS